MTMDEFKKNIAPYMKEGYVAMDKDTNWFYYSVKPKRNDILGQWRCRYSYTILDRIFTIRPVENWTQSLIEVGK